MYKAFPVLCRECQRERGCVDFRGRQASEGLGNTVVAGQSRHVGEIDSDCWPDTYGWMFNEAGERGSR